MHHITSDHIFARSGQCYTLRILIELLKNLGHIRAFRHHASCRIKAYAKSMAAAFYGDPDPSAIFLQEKAAGRQMEKLPCFSP